MTRGDTFVFGNHDITAFVGDVKTCNFTAQTLGDKFHLCTAVHQTEIIIDKEVGQYGFGCQANGFEQKW